MARGSWNASSAQTPEGVSTWRKVYRQCNCILSLLSNRWHSVSLQSKMADVLELHEDGDDFQVDDEGDRKYCMSYII